MILVDTDVLIAHLRGVPPASRWLHDARREGPVLASVITVAELTGGMRSTERATVRRLLRAIDAIPVTDLIAHRAGDLQREFRRSHQGIGLPDYVIAATAEMHGVPLATLNVRRFPMFPGLAPPFTVS